ncbi:hypothetical protein C8R46DRAFT_1328165 [Mycena filopes]|nr:hypothetical protein C8R46DRAFT_1328165 [Mycena filopes]
MAHLRRWPTPPSIYSDWTDSKPLGATMSIHALAKPLSKFLYHGQAIGIIETNRGTPLSRDTADILTTYLTFKNILPSTRALVLLDLSDRAGSSELDAQVIPILRGLELHPQLVPLLSDSCSSVQMASVSVLKALDMAETSINGLSPSVFIRLAIFTHS